MAKMARVAYWTFIICFPVLLITSTIRLQVNSIHTYEYGFDKYEISEVTGIDEPQLSQVATRLIDYFNSRVETPQIKVVKEGMEFELFHDYELVHLEDVKGQFQLAYWVQRIVLAYVVIYAALAVILGKRSNRRISTRTGFLLWEKGRWQDLTKGVTRGCILTLGIIGVLGIVSIFNFRWLFIRFHYLVFGDPSVSPWMLDPSRDYLIMLFPSGFWQDIAIIGVGAVAAEALFLGGIAWAVSFIHQRRSCRTKLSSEKDS